MLALRRELPTVHAVANASVLDYGNKRERLMLDNDDAKAVISRKTSGHLLATSDHESDQGNALSTLEHVLYVQALPRETSHDSLP